MGEIHENIGINFQNKEGIDIRNPVKDFEKSFVPTNVCNKIYSTTA